MKPGDTSGEQSSYRNRWLTSQDSLRLYYRDYGDAAGGRTPILCLPGLARHSHDFHPVAARLAHERRVVVVDYRGRGRSDKAPGWRHYAAEHHLNDLRHVIAATGLHRAILIGTSFGGLLSMGLGVVVPRIVAGVVLNDIGPEVSAGGQQRILTHLAEGRPQPDWASAVAHLKIALPHLPFSTDAEWEQFARGTYLETDGGELRAAWDTNIVKSLQRGGGGQPDLWALFGSLRNVPVLLVRGALTDLLSEETAARMAALHPDLTRVTVPKVGHAPMLTESECVEAIDDFLERIPDQPARH